MNFYRKIRQHVCLLSIVLLVAGCASDRFVLIDQSTGQQAGPFTYQTGSRVMVGGKAYQIMQVGTRDQATEQYLKLTIIPECEMCSANVYDFVGELNRNLKDFGPTNSTLRFDLPQIQIDAPPTYQTNYSVFIRGARNISAYDCLRRACEQLDLKFMFDGKFVLLKPMRPPE